MKKDSEKTLYLIAKTLFDSKGFNILALDVREISSLTDFFLIGEGSSDRHVQALANAIEKVLSAEGEEPIHVEGRAEGEWIVLDYLEIVVHLFKPTWRDRYRLEELWRQGKIVELEFASSQSGLATSRGN